MRESVYKYPKGMPFNVKQHKIMSSCTIDFFLDTLLSQPRSSRQKVTLNMHKMHFQESKLTPGLNGLG